MWTSDWYQLPIACISEGDAAVWPFSVGLLLKFVHFLGNLHWPCGAGDLGVGGVSHLELLILYERWAGERLVIEGAVPWVVSVFAVSHWCKSLPASAVGLGKVWAWSYFSAQGNVRSRHFRFSAEGLRIPCEVWWFAFG